MRRTIITIAPFILLLAISGCKDKTETDDYLNLVLGHLERIESASYTIESESWQPGDTRQAGLPRSFSCLTNSAS